MTPFEAFLECQSVSTDTRSIAKGSVFFALKGANFNGNRFALQALEQGASYAVVDENLEASDSRVIQVADVLESLQSTAQLWRQHLDIPIIGLTGSNGKTTNKELFHAVLSKAYNVHATPGNLNNHIGVPLTLLSIQEGTDIAVVEMGANHQQEIGFLANLAEPDLGYITNYGKAHLEGFGGVEGIIKGKSELFDYLASTNKEALVNADDPIQVERSSSCSHTYFFGTQKGDVIWEPTSDTEFASIRFQAGGKWWTVTSQLSGTFNESNLAAAACVGIKFGVEPINIVQALEGYTPSMNRVEWRHTGKNRVLLDAYNANPTSMSLSVESFIKWHDTGWMVLGDMFELGADAAREHQSIVTQIEDLDAQRRCILVGRHFGATSWDGLQFDTTEELTTYWNEKGAPRDAYILLKGSRGIALEKLLPLL